MEVNGIHVILDGISPMPRRVFWALVVCGGTCLAMYQVFLQLEMFFQYPVSSSVDIRYITCFQAYPKSIGNIYSSEKVMT